MDDKHEIQDFDLDDILKEFGEPDRSELTEAEPDQELEELLQMPRLDIAPVAVKTPETGKVVPEETESAVSREDTVVFQPLQMEGAEDDTGVIPVDAVTADTAVLPDAQTEAAPAVEPAFEVEPEFIPEPILFQPKGAKLRELKKKLMDGPEKRFYELTEVGTGSIQIAILINLLIVLGCAAITVLFATKQIPVNRLRLVIFSQVLAMLLSGLLGSHLMIDGLAELLKGKFSINTLLTVTFVACIADSLLCLRDLRVPCCAAFCLEMVFALMARHQKRATEISQMDTMRKASRLNGIIKVEDYYEDMPGLMRREAQVEDFMETYNKVSGPELIQSIYAGLSLIACIAIAGFAFVMHGLELAVQILTTSLLVAVPASFFVSVSRPMAILEKRLHMVGTLLCGWESVKDLCGKAVFPLRDRDLFPKGSTKFNGIKFYGDREPEEVVGYAAALIKAGGGGLVSIFAQLRVSRNAPEYPVENFQYYGNGGIGGEVCGEPVLLGTLTFLQDMGVEIPEGTMVNQAVYVSVDGQLSAVCAISYAKMRFASAGLVTLNGYRKITPLILCGDFMITEEFIRTKFEIKPRRMAFPSREERDRLRKRRPDPEEPVLAITTREELISAAYAVTGARALRQATKLGLIIHLLGGILGMVIMLALAYLGSTELLTPVNVLLFQLVWAVPGLLVTEWARTV